MTELQMDALPPRQRDVLGQIACGQDQFHPPRVVVELASKGLIVGREETLPGWPPVRVVLWELPVDVHMQWAAWCAQQPDEHEETT